MKFFFHFLVLFGVYNPVLCQRPLPRIITSEEFLKQSSDISYAYDIEVDSRGYVHFVGTSGNHRFNGDDFTWVKTKSNSVNGGIQKGYDQQLLYTCLDGSISHLSEDVIRRVPISDSLKKIGRRGYHTVYKDEAKTMHLCPVGHGYLTLDSMGTALHKFERSAGLHGFFIKQLSDGKWIHFSTFQKFDEPRQMSLYFIDENDGINLITEMADTKPHFQSSLVMHADSSLSISVGTKEIIRFKKKKLISRHLFDHMIIELFVDSKDRLWVGTVDHGFFKIENSNFSQLEQYWGGAAAIVTEDAHGGLWFKSDTVGFGYITPLAIPHYSKQTGHEGIDDIEKIVPGNNELVIKNALGQIFLLKGDSLVKLDFPKIDHVGGKRTVYDFPIDVCFNPVDEKYWFSFYGRLLSWDGENWDHIELDQDVFTNLHITYIKVLHDGKIIGTTKNRLFTVDNREVIPISESSSSNITGFAVDKKDQIWVGKRDGVWFLDSNKFTRSKLIPNNSQAKTEVTFMFSYQDEIWVQSYGYGVYRITKNGIKPVYYNGQNLLIANYSIDSNGSLWGISSHTDNLLKINKINSELEISSFGFTDFSAKHNYQVNLVVTDKFVFYGTNNGLFKASIENLSAEKRIPHIVFTDILINGEPDEIRPHYNLSYSQNYINATYDYINARRFLVEISHKMTGIDSNWVNQEYYHLQYTNLAPGDYDLLVRARSVYGKWGETAVLHFHIAKPYWQTWWFRITVLVLLVLIISLLVRLRIYQIRKKEEEKGRIALELSRLELRALKAQINPHFIFNSITSVMYYLSQEKRDVAESYLERFSILIRKVLESSDQNMVSLTSEIELMRHYVTLESEWYEGEPIKLITSFQGLDPDSIKIPPTLLQPYIENAIRHGLKPKKNDRLIYLDFTLNKDAIGVRITDNGIGRKKAAEQDTRENHKSYGMSISSRRIELLNQKSISQIFIDDLTDEKGEGIGTSIHFNVPFSRELSIA